MPRFKAEIGHISPPRGDGGADAVLVNECIEAPNQTAALELAHREVAEVNRAADREVGKSHYYSGTVTVTPLAA